MEFLHIVPLALQPFGQQGCDSNGPMLAAGAADSNIQCRFSLVFIQRNQKFEKRNESIHKLFGEIGFKNIVLNLLIQPCF